LHGYIDTRTFLERGQT